MIIITTCLLCSSCGVKDMPEHKSQKNFNQEIKII